MAVITGAASGIGKANAAEFVRNGAKVVIADVQDDLGLTVAAELGGPDTACYARCDVTDEAQVAAAVDLAVARHGRLDVMFNNTGVTGGNYAGGSIESMDMADFDRVMAVNLRGVAAGIKHAARAMVPRCEGCILCTSSTAGALGGSAPHAYNVSKTAVVGMVRSAAAELAARGVRVNAISPYAIATSIGSRAVKEMMGLPPVGAGAGDEEAVRQVFEKDFNQMGGGVVLRAEEVARAAMFLASDDIRYITGHNLPAGLARRHLLQFRPTPATPDPYARRQGAVPEVIAIRSWSSSLSARCSRPRQASPLPPVAPLVRSGGGEKSALGSVYMRDV